ncbi:MAG: apolipoprotein N-acyltransferase, partial [Bacillati bacterium ANGP1]
MLWVPLVWTAVEFLRSQGALGFPWALLGATQHRAAPVIQVASLGGVYAVSFLVALVNAALYVILTRRAVLLPAAGAGVVLAAALVYGLNVLRHPVPATFTAAVVQPGFPVRAQLDPGLARRRFEDLGQLTQKAAARGAAL